MLFKMILCLLSFLLCSLDKDRKLTHIIKILPKDAEKHDANKFAFVMQLYSMINIQTFADETLVCLDMLKKNSLLGKLDVRNFIAHYGHSIFCSVKKILIESIFIKLPINYEKPYLRVEYDNLIALFADSDLNRIIDDRLTKYIINTILKKLFLTFITAFYDTHSLILNRKSNLDSFFTFISDSNINHLDILHRNIFTHLNSIQNEIKTLISKADFNIDRNIININVTPYFVQFTKNNTQYCILKNFTDCENCMNCIKNRVEFQNMVTIELDFLVKKIISILPTIEKYHKKLNIIFDLNQVIFYFKHAINEVCFDAEINIMNSEIVYCRIEQLFHDTIKSQFVFFTDEVNDDMYFIYMLKDYLDMENIDANSLQFSTTYRFCTLNILQVVVKLIDTCETYPEFTCITQISDLFDYISNVHIKELKFEFLDKIKFLDTDDLCNLSFMNDEIIKVIASIYATIQKICLKKWFSRELFDLLHPLNMQFENIEHVTDLLALRNAVLNFNLEAITNTTLLAICDEKFNCNK